MKINQSNSDFGNRLPILEAKQLAIGYPVKGKRPTLVANNLSLALGKGEFICLLGPNGAGKSTLIRTLAGMQKPLRGEVLVAGKEITRLNPKDRAQRMSVVLTDKVQLNAFSAYALVALGRYPYTNWIGRLSEKDVERVNWAMQVMQIAHLSNRSLSDLSDGERQKVMIARALAQEPEVILLDEPTAFLDLPRRVELMHRLRDLAHQEHRAIMLSTHDLDLALRTADRVWLLHQGGPIVEGAPEDLVVSGDLEEAFCSSGVIFDVSSGSFTLNHPKRGVAWIQGQNLGLNRWARRALERVGFEIVQEQATLQIECWSQAQKVQWRIKIDGKVIEGASFAHLVDQAKRLCPAR